MKVKKSKSDDKVEEMSLSGSSVFNRLGNPWTSENKQDRNNRVSKRESPRKKVKKDDLRKRIQKTFNEEEHNEERVHFKAPDKIETDEVVLKRREKQISYGKNTIAYDKYISLIPKTARTEKDPRTPQKHRKYSRRQWEGIVKKWKLNIYSAVAELEDADSQELGKIMDDGSSIGSWIDDVEEEEDRRSRASLTSSSSDQGLGGSICSSSSDFADNGDVF